MPFDRAAEGGPRTAETGNTNRRRLRSGLYSRSRPSAYGLLRRPAVDGQIFVAFV